MESRTGAGTFVTEDLPESWFKSDTKLVTTTIEPQHVLLSNYAKDLNLENIGSIGGNQSFTVGVPDLKAFPAKLWNKIAHSIPQAGLTGLTGFQPPQGHPDLREAVTDYVSNSKAVRCEHGQVIITQGIQQALDICARLFINPGDPVAMENPATLTPAMPCKRQVPLSPLFQSIIMVWWFPHW